MALQRLVSARQLIQDRLQVPHGVVGGDEFTVFVDDIDHEAAALDLLRLDDGLPGLTEFVK